VPSEQLSRLILVDVHEMVFSEQFKPELSGSAG